MFCSVLLLHAATWCWARHDEVQCKPWSLAQGPFGWRKFRRWRGQEECNRTFRARDQENWPMTTRHETGSYWIQRMLMARLSFVFQHVPTIWREMVLQPPSDLSWLQLLLIPGSRRGRASTTWASGTDAFAWRRMILCMAIVLAMFAYMVYGVLMRLFEDSLNLFGKHDSGKVRFKRTNKNKRFRSSPMPMLNRNYGKSICTWDLQVPNDMNQFNSTKPLHVLSQVDAPKETPPEPAAPATPGEIAVGCQVLCRVWNCKCRKYPEVPSLIHWIHWSHTCMIMYIYI